MWIINFFIFMTTAFPKAGAVLGGISITVAEILFIIAIIKSRKEIWKFFRQNKIWFYIYVIYIVTITISIFANIKVAPLFRIAISLVLLISPLAVGIGYKSNFEKTMKIIAISLIIVGGYALLQWTIGIEKTAIQGLIIAYGDSFSNKTIGLRNGRFRSDKNAINLSSR